MSRRLLIIKPSSLGDIVHGLQTLQALRAQVPDWEVTWLVRDTFAALPEQAAAVDHVIRWSRRAGWRGLWATMRDLRRGQPFAAVADWQGLARSGLFTWAARAPLKLGRSDAREGARLAYQRCAPLPAATGRQSHALAILLQFLPLLGASRIELDGPLRWRGLPPPPWPMLARPPLLLFPDSRRPEKEWPHFGALAVALRRSWPAQPVVWAGGRPLPTPPELAGDTAFINLAGQTALSQLPAMIAGAALVVANDSAPLHLAAAAGRPLVAVFGPTSPTLYGPFPVPGATGRTEVVMAPGGRLLELSPAAVLAACERCRPPGA